MNEEAEQLEALFRRAVENGWERDYWGPYLVDGKVNPRISVQGFLKGMGYPENPLWHVVLDHDFAKALFGDATFTQYISDIRGLPGKDARDEGTTEMYVFDYHRQHAVISDEPIYYMYKAVFG